MSEAVVITPEAILAYPALFEPRTSKMNEGGGAPQYECALIFLPGTDLTTLHAAIKHVINEKWGAEGPEMVRDGRLRMPFKPANVKKGHPAGAVIINARSKLKPGLVMRHAGPDGKPAPITDRGELYPGARVRASLKAFVYDTKTNKGASFWLNNVQKLGEGKRIAGRMLAEDEFDVLEDTVADLL